MPIPYSAKRVTGRFQRAYRGTSQSNGSKLLLVLACIGDDCTASCHRRPRRCTGAGFGGHTSSDGHYGPIHDDSGASLALDAFMLKTCDLPDTGCQSGAQPVRRLGVFHAHSHDMPFLDQWIGEILDLRQNSTNSISPTRTS